ncbi:MAG: nucleotidyl transferase AbiEii/AbiGii toxin family protein [Deltaproteobacteria bacterium]|nr:nucleotidyl transferase AbiEii/AbiGii toxin family protein [Deltaproteobacteria bacterium]
MSGFATLPVAEWRLLIEQVAARQRVAAVIVEKDFWVCWVLGHIFAAPAMAPHVVFKGGTSLSKVFGIIDRFSEDVDLAVAPGSLGFAEADLDEAPSPSQRAKRVKELTRRCEAFVRDQLQPALESVLVSMLGSAQRGSQWLAFEIDAAAATPNLWFTYPSALPQPGGYVAKRVKLELGSLTCQRPTGCHTIAPMLATTLGATYDDFTSSVVALELARTFWEKATILHAEYHRPPERTARDRFARHHADFAALWRHESRVQSLARMDLLEDVVRHKSRFFSSSWATYDTARRGSFRLVPPEYRRVALARDYASMRPMFLSDPLPFDELLDQLASAERALNE